MNNTSSNKMTLNLLWCDKWNLLSPFYNTESTIDQLLYGLEWRYCDNNINDLHEEFPDCSMSELQVIMNQRNDEIIDLKKKLYIVRNQNKILRSIISIQRRFRKSHTKV